MIAEALIGAALVLFALVAHDASFGRALSVSLHLVNTFLLLASTALTAWSASTRPPERLRSDVGNGPIRWAVGAPLVAALVVAASGALTALGDTLFPAASVAAGFAQDFAPGAHAFVRLRALHPVLAVTTAVGIVVASGFTRALRPTRRVRTLSRAAAALAIGQVLLGMVDVLTLAPVYMQLAHLVLADTLWIALVLTAAAALGDAPEIESEREASSEAAISAGG
jgi:heme A synthase